MLNPNQDRLDYGRILSSPSGYKLDFAIGTTYSLDLDALVGACIALGLSEETDSDLMKNPICLLEALRSTGDKVALFCEGGQIHLPGNITHLYVLLEKMVYQVNAVKRKDTKGFPSFHPKFWLIRYINDEKNVLYRVVILSRNLTFDRSWDVTFYMDGMVEDTETMKNTPVQDFLQFLMRNLGDDDSSREKNKKIKSIIRELPRVRFDTGDKMFHDYEFIPAGIKKSSGGYHSILDTNLFANYGNIKSKDGLHEIFIMSPFVSNDVIKYYNDRSPYIDTAEYMLITREMSLSKLKPADCGNFNIYTIRDDVIDGESILSDESADAPRKQDIHAKVFLTRKYTETDLYLGSLNASHNAVFGNVEFMICLHSKNRYLNMDKIAEDLFDYRDDGKNNPFKQVKVEDAVCDEEEEKNSLLDGVIKKINRMNLNAAVSNAGEFYDVTIRCNRMEDIGDYCISFSPLLAKKTVPFTDVMTFGNLPITDLSEFYIVTVGDGSREVSRVIKVPTEGMPEGREKAVVSSIVKDEDCFYRYVAFLLGDNFVLSAMESSQQNRTGLQGNSKANHGLPALYEKMLQTAASAPDRFKELDYLIQAISKDGVIPAEFEELYNTFRKVVKI